jgi:hypothetical protein
MANDVSVDRAAATGADFSAPSTYGSPLKIPETDRPLPKSSGRSELRGDHFHGHHEAHGRLATTGAERASTGDDRCIGTSGVARFRHTEDNVGLPILRHRAGPISDSLDDSTVKTGCGQVARAFSRKVPPSGQK